MESSKRRQRVAVTLEATVYGKSSDDNERVHVRLDKSTETVLVAVNRANGFLEAPLPFNVRTVAIKGRRVDYHMRTVFVCRVDRLAKTRTNDVATLFDRKNRLTRRGENSRLIDQTSYCASFNSLLWLKITNTTNEDLFAFTTNIVQIAKIRETIVK